MAVADLGPTAVKEIMTAVGKKRPDIAAFDAFVERVEPSLRRALIATYGPTDGREATVEALSWAWEHWDRISNIDNQVGYLYRVGQTSRRRFTAKVPPTGLFARLSVELPEIEPGLIPALESLSEQQRIAVVLVHAYGWSQADVARLHDINPSTVREHLARGLKRLRSELEADDDH